MPTRHCHQCGWEYAITGQPGRTESCHQCGADLKVCLNCIHFELRAAHQCREKRADPVMDKRTANFCEYFEMIRREWKGRAADAREDKARENLKKLFGD
jgi:ribosome-binding protein aMBF1 (putative translation factor)